MTYGSESECATHYTTAPHKSLAATTPQEFLITGDFNLHLDDPTNSKVQQFLSALDSTDLTQHISFPTHRENHTLDLVITANTSSLSPVIDYSPVSPSDHFLIFSTLTIAPLPSPPLIEFSFRCLKSISLSKFTQDILTSQLITHPPTHLSDLVDSYNSTLSTILDKHSPLKTKAIRAKPPNRWLIPALSKLRSARHLEKIWLRTRSSQDPNYFALPPTPITQPRKFSTLHSSHLPPKILANFGTLSINFFIASLCRSFPLTLNLNL